MIVGLDFYYGGFMEKTTHTKDTYTEGSYQIIFLYENGELYQVIGTYISEGVGHNLFNLTKEEYVSTIGIFNKIK